MTLDNKLRNKEFEQWLVGDLPTFRFANDINPWCECQGDAGLDSGDEIIINKNDSIGEQKWTWGKIKRSKNSSWIDYDFKFVKENGSWKIAYMKGFDIENTQKDGL